MTFSTVAEAYNFYKNTSKETMESRTKAIQAEISGNANADIQAYNIELEGIESALSEKRSDQGERRSEPVEKRPDAPGFTASETTEDGAGTKVYRNAFYKHLLGNDLTAGERRVFQAVNSEKRADAFNNLSNAAAVIPTQTLDQIIVKARDMGGIMSIANAFDIPANISMPVATPGSAAQWHVEGATVESEMADPASVTFGANEIMKVLSMSVATRTMSIDAFESYLTDQLTQSVMACLAQAMVNGDGQGKATGILTGINWTEGDNLLAVGADEWSDWRTFTRMIAMLHRGYSTNATFVMNNRTLYENVISLHDDNNRPVYLFDVQNATTGHLLGFPVVVDDFMPDNDIVFGNFKYYGYNMPGGLMLDVSRESSFKSGLIDYRAMAVADAKPIIDEAFVRLTVGA